MAALAAGPRGGERARGAGLTREPARHAAPRNAAPRHAGFLRAINVGGRTVTMERLRAILAGIPGTPLRDVETFIASGNVVFTAAAKDTRDATAVAALERRIERQLEDALGWEVATFVRSLDALVALAGATPFAGVAEGHTLSVGFMHAPLAPEAEARLLALADARNTFAVHGADVWWWTKGKLSESGIEPRHFERALGKTPITMRNVTTVRRLAAKYGG